MTKELVHAILLIISIALMFLFPQSPLRDYDLEIAAGLFIVLFVTRRFAFFSRRSRLFESIVFTLIILGIVNTTGGMSSPYFFLIYRLQQIRHAIGKTNGIKKPCSPSTRCLRPYMKLRVRKREK